MNGMTSTAVCSPSPSRERGSSVQTLFCGKPSAHKEREPIEHAGPVSAAPPGKSALLILYQQRFQQVQIVQQLLQRFVADLPRGAQMVQLGAL